MVQVLHVTVAVAVTVIMALLSFFEVIHLTTHLRSKDHSGFLCIRHLLVLLLVGVFSYKHTHTSSN